MLEIQKRSENFDLQKTLKAMSLNQDNATSIQSLRMKALSLQNDIAFAAQKQEVERDFLRQQIAKTDKELEALKAEVSDSEDDNEDSAPSTPTQVQQDTTLPTASDGGLATPPPRKRGRRMPAGNVSSSNSSPTISLFRTPRRSSSRQSIRRASRAAFLQEKRRQLEDAAAVAGARPNVVILSEDDFPMPSYDRRRSSLTLSSSETSIDSAQSETASDKLPVVVYSDLEEGTKLQMAARKLKKKLNLNPWEPTSLAKYDDGNTRDLIKEYPQVCRVKLDGLESFPPAPIFPLNVACALGASLKTIMHMYRAYPVALENDFAVKDSPVGNVIHFCVSYGAPLEVVEFLVDASSTNLLSHTNNFGRTPLHLACVFKASYKVIEYLFNECPYAAEMHDKNGFTPLVLAKEFDAGRNAIELLSQATSSNRQASKLTIPSPAPRTPRTGKRRSTTGGRRRSTLIRLNLGDDEEGGSSEFMSPPKAPKTPKTPRTSRSSCSNAVDEMFAASSQKQQLRARTILLATPVAGKKGDLETSRAIPVEPLAAPPLAAPFERGQANAVPAMTIAVGTSQSTIISSAKQDRPAESGQDSLLSEQVSSVQPSDDDYKQGIAAKASKEHIAQPRQEYLSSTIRSAKCKSSESTPRDESTAAVSSFGNDKHLNPASEPTMVSIAKVPSEEEELAQLRMEYHAKRISNAKRRSKFKVQSEAGKKDEYKKPAASPSSDRAEEMDDVLKKPAVSSPPTSPEHVKPISMLVRRKQLIDKARAKARQQHRTSLSSVNGSNHTATSSTTCRKASKKKSSMKPASSSSTTASRSSISLTASSNKIIKKQSVSNKTQEKQEASAISRLFGRFVRNKKKKILAKSTFSLASLAQKE